ncbi:hypothetical protein [uncultured Victivallis sp.]|uniref:hypothetical protein n=1 Tax=uncultured Victivallis sp. TaxID=354118 RepID=UPI0025D33EDE|nr:hypothetical protein [uncultured Victivallis sp.]
MIEPVIGHCKSEHRMERNQLCGSRIPYPETDAGICSVFIRFSSLHWFGTGSAREEKNLSSKGFSFPHPIFA